MTRNGASITNGTTTTTTTTTTTPKDISSYRTSLDRDGFVLIPSILPASQIDLLRSACADVTQLARDGHWPHLRTLPKQFPPWPSDPSQGIWGVQHLLHPSMPHQRTFAASYFAAGIRDVLCALLFPSAADAGTTTSDDKDSGGGKADGGGDGDGKGNADGGGKADAKEEQHLVMELYNLLVTPDTDFALRWHRDDIPSDASTEEEEQRLCADQGRTRQYAHAQWNLALFDDESLVVVPGSHRRARTDAERSAGPYEAVLEGMKVVKLKPGDVVFYDNNILHRGVYWAGRERMTLHGSVGVCGKGEERARNVLQHGIGGWVERCDFTGLDEVEEGMGTRAEAMKKRLVDMGRGRQVEYSQPD